MLREAFWVDHRPRVDFYVRHGLIARAPTDAQLQAGFREIRDRGGVVERLQHYLRHPMLIFPTAAKKRAVEQSHQDIAERGYAAASDAGRGTAHPGGGLAAEPLLDRALKRTFLFAPARFATQCVFNPWTPVPTIGLNVPVSFMIAHILQTPHPFPLWDIQIVAADPGGLDELEAKLGAAIRGSGVRARIDRALGYRPGYYDCLSDVIPKIRGFQYPQVPAGLTAISQDLVVFLAYAAEL